MPNPVADQENGFIPRTVTQPNPELTALRQWVQDRINRYDVRKPYAFDREFVDNLIDELQEVISEIEKRL